MSFPLSSGPKLFAYGAYADRRLPSLLEEEGYFTQWDALPSVSTQYRKQLNSWPFYFIEKKKKEIVVNSPPLQKRKKKIE